MAGCAKRVERALAAFLAGPAKAVGLHGDVGAGKLFLVEKVCRARGLQYQILDRAEGAIDYKNLGSQMTLASDDVVATSVFVVVNAKERDWGFLRVLLTNSYS